MKLEGGDIEGEGDAGGKIGGSREGARQQVARQRADQTRFLAERDKEVRGYRAANRMQPSGENFEAGKASCAQLHERLEKWDDLACVDGPGQIARVSFYHDWAEGYTQNGMYCCTTSMGGDR